MSKDKTNCLVQLTLLCYGNMKRHATNILEATHENKCTLDPSWNPTRTKICRKTSLPNASYIYTTIHLLTAPMHSGYHSTGSARPWTLSFRSFKARDSCTTASFLYFLTFSPPSQSPLHISHLSSTLCTEKVVKVPAPCYISSVRGNCTASSLTLSHSSTHTTPNGTASQNRCSPA